MKQKVHSHVSVCHPYSIRIPSVYFPIATCSDFRRIRTEYGWGNHFFEVFPNNTRVVVAPKPMSFSQAMKVVKLHMYIDLSYCTLYTVKLVTCYYMPTIGHRQHLNLKNDMREGKGHPKISVKVAVIQFEFRH